MRLALTTAGLLLAAALAVADQPAAAPASVQQEIEALQVELIAALRSGDRPALERLLADGFTFVHATGGLDTKREHIDGVAAAAAAGRAPNIERLEQQVQAYDGRTAVTVSRAVLRGRGEDTLLRSTHVYVKTGGRWQWAGGQSTRLPNRPAATATLPPALRDAYAGRYQVGPDRVLTVSVQADTLRAHLPGFKEAELVPRTESEFAWFNPELNLESQVVFVRDADGAVTHAAYRRDGKEVWRAARLK
jgi:ketosteroid isomerase-like protein